MISDGLLNRMLEAFALDRNTPDLISHTCNAVYRVTKGGVPYILRISEKSWNAVDQLNAEIHWVRYLADHGVRAPLPLAATDGEYTVVVHEGEMWIIGMVFELAQGVFFDKDSQLWEPSLFRKWGAVMGDMHRTSKEYVPAYPASTRPHWSRMKVDNPYLLTGDYLVLLERLRELEGRLSDLPRDKDAYGLIHYDLHPYNFLIDEGEITVFDFDDALHGWFALDIGVAAAHAVWCGTPNQDRAAKHEFAKSFLDEFLTGYLQHHSLDKYWIEQIPMFMDYRNVSSFFWLLSSWNGDESILSDMQKTLIARGAEVVKRGLPFDGCDIQL